MHPSKALGPDDMSSFFFQRFWHIVGQDVTKAVLSILHSGRYLHKINYTHLVLIPKKSNPQNITENRPISLGNVVSRLISNVVANRVKPMLPCVTSDSQSAFVLGRLITDNITIAFEMVHRVWNRRWGKVGHMTVKLDISKAYDRVEWDFLEKIMTSLGFPVQWMNLAMSTVRSASYSVIVNGESCGYITPSRGIKQGDPLSPYLSYFAPRGSHPCCVGQPLTITWRVFYLVMEVYVYHIFSSPTTVYSSVKPSYKKVVDYLACSLNMKPLLGRLSVGEKPPCSLAGTLVVRYKMTYGLCSECKYWQIVRSTLFTHGGGEIKGEHFQGASGKSL